MSSSSSSRNTKGSSSAVIKDAKNNRSNVSFHQDKIAARIREKQQQQRRQQASSFHSSNYDDDEEEKIEEGMIMSTSRIRAENDDYDDDISKSNRINKKSFSVTATNATSYKATSITNSDNNGRRKQQQKQQKQPISTQGGGEDVRNRPPPSLANLERSRQQQQRLAIRASAEEAQDRHNKNNNEWNNNNKMKKQQVNSRFVDLHETGQWGGLTSCEKYGICLLTLIAIIVAIVLGVRFGSNNNLRNENTQTTTKAPLTLKPSIQPTWEPTVVGQRLPAGLALMKTISPTESLPIDNPEELMGSKTRPDSTPQMLAAEFMLYDDTLQSLSVHDPIFLERYALSVFYYANGGCVGDWISSNNWMMEDSVNNNNENNVTHCGQVDGSGKWYGVFCNLQGRVTELKMSKNFVTWKLPHEFVALTELSTLDLSENRMVGELPSEAISMPGLFTLLLHNNDFEGMFPFDVVKKGAANLDTLWIQENPQLSGSVPFSFCSLGSITLDCANFQPQPVYVSSDSSVTTFESECKAESKGVSPREYTCNEGVGVPVEKPTWAPPPSPSRICGTPSK
jgi:hypothetical protein